jgi:copper transport protein
MRRWLAAALFILVAAAFAGLPARLASAHATLQSSTPAANSVLEAGPSYIVLDFDDAVDASVSSIQLYSQDAKVVAIAKPQPGADPSIVQAAVPLLGVGLYAVVWRVTSQDGHVVDGAFSFQIGTSTPSVDSGGLLSTVRHGVVSPPSVGRWYGAGRALSMLGFIVLFGGALFALTRPLLSPTLWLLRGAWLLLVFGSALGFAFYASKVVGGSVGDAFRTGVWREAARTHSGRLLLVRLGAAGFLGLLLSTIHLAGAAWWRVLAAAGALAAVASFSFAGHPYTQRPRALWVGIDAVHLVAVSVWIGGLLLFALGGKSWFADEGRAAVVRTFSRISTVAVPVVVATGVLATLRLVRDLHDLTDTSWGRTLLVKVTVVVVIVAIGGVSHWLLRNDGPVAVRRTVAAEALLGVAVVGLAAGLVGLPPRAAPASQAFSASLSNAGVVVDVSISPGSVGANEVHLVVTPPGGNLAPVTSLTARMALPEANLPESPVTIDSAGPNHYIGAITLPRSGQWTLEIIVEPEPAQTVSLKTTVPIP